MCIYIAQIGNNRMGWARAPKMIRWQCNHVRSIYAALQKWLVHSRGLVKNLRNLSFDCFQLFIRVYPKTGCTLIHSHPSKGVTFMLCPHAH